MAGVVTSQSLYPSYITPFRPRGWWASLGGAGRSECQGLGSLNSPLGVNQRPLLGSCRASLKQSLRPLPGCLRKLCLAWIRPVEWKVSCCSSERYGRLESRHSPECWHKRLVALVTIPVAADVLCDTATSKAATAASDLTRLYDYSASTDLSTSQTPSLPLCYPGRGLLLAPPPSLDLHPLSPPSLLTPADRRRKVRHDP
jgi:hypothetical protein